MCARGEKHFIFILLPFLAMCFCEFRDSQEQNIKQILRNSGKTGNPEHISEKVVVGGAAPCPPLGAGVPVDANFRKKNRPPKKRLTNFGNQAPGAPFCGTTFTEKRASPFIFLPGRDFLGGP